MVRIVIQDSPEHESWFMVARHPKVEGGIPYCWAAVHRVYHLPPTTYHHIATSLRQGTPGQLHMMHIRLIPLSVVILHALAIYVDIFGIPVQVSPLPSPAAEKCDVKEKKGEVNCLY